MKKFSLLMSSLIFSLIFLTPAFACRGGWGPGAGYAGYGPGPGYCNGPYYSRGQGGDKRIDQARQRFLAESKELRKQLYDKKTAYYNLLDQKKPNKREAAKLWNEIFEIQFKLQKMAAAEGFSPDRIRARGWGGNGSYGPGCGCRCRGYGWGGGWGPGGWYGTGRGYGRRWYGRRCFGPGRYW